MYIDEGEWTAAVLGDDDINDAWRTWAFKWEAVESDHSVEVRAIDKN